MEENPLIVEVIVEPEEEEIAEDAEETAVGLQFVQGAFPGDPIEFCDIHKISPILPQMRL